MTEPLTELRQLTATKLTALIRADKVSEREAAEAAIGRLEAVNLALDAVVAHRPEQVRAAADGIDRALAAQRKPVMSSYVALIISIGVLAVADTYLTGTILPIPVWVTFIAWASFFTCGGGKRGFLQSVASNWTGILIAAASLFCARLLGGSAEAAAICVGVGSAAMIVVTKVPTIPKQPAIVFRFASLVGTTVASNRPVTTPSLANPILVAGCAMLIGALFGLPPN